MYEEPASPTLAAASSLKPAVFSLPPSKLALETAAASSDAELSADEEPEAVPSSDAALSDDEPAQAEADEDTSIDIDVRSADEDASAEIDVRSRLSPSVKSFAGLNADRSRAPRTCRLRSTRRP